MEYQIDIRPFQPEDQEALAGVIRRTWQYDRFCGPKTAQRLGRVYLHAWARRSASRGAWRW